MSFQSNKGILIKPDRAAMSNVDQVAVQIDILSSSDVMFRVRLEVRR